MKKMILLGFSLSLTACGGPSRINVYGASGKAYTAPDLCAALIQCQNSTETSCYYDKELVTYSDGSHMESGCKEIKK
jgi:hypothetical protein